jgi:hypothetical protein
MWHEVVREDRTHERGIVETVTTDVSLKLTYLPGVYRLSLTDLIILQGAPRFQEDS